MASGKVDLGSGQTVEWDYANPFVMSFRVAVDDVDGLGHTNNGVYVRWCDNAAWAHSSALGMEIDDHQRINRSVAIRRSEYDYLLPSHEGDELELATWIYHCDNKLTMERRFQIRRPADGKNLLRGRWELIGIALDTGKPKRLPQLFIDVYGSIAVCNISGNVDINQKNGIAYAAP